jgi:hypothetical protein
VARLREWERGQEEGSGTTLRLKPRCFVLDEVGRTELVGRRSESGAEMEGHAGLASDRLRGMGIQVDT